MKISSSENAFLNYTLYYLNIVFNVCKFVKHTMWFTSKWDGNMLYAAQTH